jgi:Mg-chelatase subunit ChlD/uncharacterized membrane protein
MEPVLRFLATHWLASALALLCLSLSVVWFWRRLRQVQKPALLVAAIALGMFALGGLTLAANELANWLAFGSFIILFLLLVLLLTTTWWSAVAGIVGGACLLVGLGGITLGSVQQVLAGSWRFLLGLEPVQPAWLLLLLLVPVIVWMSYRSLAGLGPVRRGVAIGLRCTLVILLTLALAETQGRMPHENVTVLFLWDQSLSIPADEEARVLKFINDSVEKRGPGRERDQTGLIVFGRQARVELPPSDAPRFGLKDVISVVDREHTDIGAALKLALATFPESSGKRVVLLSDGNANRGNAEEQARQARRNGVQIDVVPLAVGRRNDSDVLVQSVEAPQTTEKGARLPIRVVLRSHHPRTVLGRLEVWETSQERILRHQDPLPVEPLPGQPGADVKVILSAKGQPVRRALEVRLRQGLNTFYFDQPIGEKDETYSYEARFEPIGVLNDRGEKIQEGLPGDRVQNNSASAPVIARGHRSVLLIEPTAGEHQPLVRQLAKDPSLKVASVEVDSLPQRAEELALVLSKYDGIILANVPADRLTDEQQEIIRSNTHDQGAGLVMIGGPNGFGAGGWQGTKVEQALPVTCDLKSFEVEGKNGLVLIMHASEMAKGNFWQKKIAKLAIEKMAPGDEFGLLYYDFTVQGNGQGGFPGGMRWHIPLDVIQKVGRAKLYSQVDSLEPGDMPDFEPGLKLAMDALTEKKREIDAKHVILISDGDPAPPGRAVLGQLRGKKVSVSTVGVATHGAADDRRMQDIADATAIITPQGRRGRYYKVKNENDLPAIYIKETRLISQSFLHTQKFQPRLLYRAGPAQGLQEELEPLYGFVRTTRRPSALVDMPIETAKIGGQPFPLLAYWQYGLGKGVAFTSDARNVWDRDWYNKSSLYGKFWQQVVEWSLRSVDGGENLRVRTEQLDGKVKVIVEAREDKTPLTNLEIRGGVTSTAPSPGGKPPALKFEQTNGGVYEAEIKAEEIGTYLFNIQARWKGKDGKQVSKGVRAAVTVPYSPEFADVGANTDLLERLRDLTDGKTYTEDTLYDVAKSGDAYRKLPLRYQSPHPLWHWLVLLAGLGLVLDVAARRIALEPAKLAAGARHLWGHLRGRRERTEQTPQFLDRLKSRKAQVAEAIEKGEVKKRRFEGEEGTAAPPPILVPQRRPDTKKEPLPPAQAEPEGEPTDFASRLQRAKRRAMEEREKRKEE